MWVVQELAIHTGSEPTLASGIGKPGCVCVSCKDMAIMGVGEK